MAVAGFASPGSPRSALLAIDGRPSQDRACLRCTAHGHPTPAAATWTDPPLGPWGAVCERTLPSDPGPPRPAQLDEPARELPRQRAHGELLRQPQERTRAPHQLPDPRDGPAGDLRVHRSFLQPPAPALRPCLLDPGPSLRADGQGRVMHLTSPSMLTALPHFAWIVVASTGVWRMAGRTP